MCPKLLFWRFSHMSKGTEFPFRAPITKMLGQQDCSGGRYCPLCCAVPDHALLCRAEVHRLLSTPKRNRVEGGICEHGYHTHALGRFPSERSSRRLARLGWSRPFAREAGSAQDGQHGEGCCGSAPPWEDVATEFRGRSVAYELLPFSFREYLRMRPSRRARERFPSAG